MPIINLSSSHRSILLTIILPILTAANLTASTFQIHDTSLDFQANDPNYHDQTSVRNTGAPAYVELYFKWTPVTTGTFPGTRQFSPLEYLPDSDIILMFGGYNSDNTTKDYSDTWVFNPGNNLWNEIVIYSTSVPTARHGHRIAWMNNRKAMLFGGVDANNQYMSDTWVYDSAQNKWDEVLCSTYPSSRAFYSMSRTANEIVLFGGSYGADKYNDTWVFDITAQTWTYRATASQPSGRDSACSAYDKADGKMYLFGGQAPALKQDLWTYNPISNSWASVVIGGPSARSNAGMCYDSRNDCIIVFGGNDGLPKSDVFYYKTAWTEGFPESTPTARVGPGFVFVSTYAPFMFGGKDIGGNFLQDSKYLQFYSTGMFTSAIVDVPFDTSLQWMSIGFSPTSLLSGTTLKLQIATRGFGESWDSFRGYDGATNTFYEFAVGDSTASTLWAGHTNKRYLRYRYLFSTTSPPSSPEIDSVMISYNRAPPAPVQLSPLNSGSTNSIHPIFTWNNSADADGDPLKYEFQLDDDNTFGSPLINATNIVQGSGVVTSTAPANAINHHTWYWHVRANDGITALSWSNTYTLYVDTIAPGQIPDLTAVTGLGNGEIRLTWTAPGDNDYSGNISSGYYQIKYATYSISNESIYASISADQRQTPVFLLTQGSQYSATVTGLSDNTTYYFSVKIGDKAGNISQISLTSPLAYTNAPPSVYLSTPMGGEYWVGTRDIAWTSYDPNWYETRSFSIYASSDSGANYSINVTTSTLLDGTTFYRWDTRQAPNGIAYRIKAVATDFRGLSGSVASPADFQIFNPNQDPVVTVTYPNGGEILFGTAILLWSISDYNGSDSHTSEIYISGDGGISYPWHYSSAGTSYSLNTIPLPNGPKYRIKVVSTDSGLPPGQGADVSDANFSINNQNIIPNAFSLIYPPDNSSRSVIDINFKWENNGDPNPEDTLSYDLYYGTAANLTGAVHVSGLTGNSYKVNPLNLISDKQYYWRVIALDPLGLQTACGNDFAIYVLSRFKTESSDNKIKAEILEGLPSNGFLSITKIDGSLSQSIRAANRDTIADRNIMKISDDAYRISACDINGNEIPVSDPKLFIIAFYDDIDNNGYCDGTLLRAENLQCAILNETRNRWELADSKPVLDKSIKNISFNLSKFGSMAFLGAITPQSKISGVVNYPNPFAGGKSSTRIRYVLTENADVSLRIYTLAGDLVWDKYIIAGAEGAKGTVNGYSNEVEWNGSNGSGVTVANGMYILELKQSGERQMRKIGVVK